MRSALFTVICVGSGCGLFGRQVEPPIVAGSELSRPPANPDSTPEPLSQYGNPAFYDALGKRYFPMKSATGYVDRGIASWYGPDFHGGLTSTREAYDMYQMTAAHKVLPLPTWVQITNLENNRSVKVRVNDRGPFKDNRIIDLSYAAALKLDMVKPGTAFVEVRALSSPASMPMQVIENGAKPLAPLAVSMYLQVGAFGERANAERLQARLANTFGPDLHIHEDAKHLFKVQVGPIRDVAHADRVVLALQELGITEHQLVTN